MPRSARLCRPLPAWPSQRPSTTPVGTQPSSLPGAAELLSAFPFPEGTSVPHMSLEHMEWAQFCLEAFGFEVEVLDLGFQVTLQAQVPPAQASEYEAASEECIEAPVDAGFVMPNAALSRDRAGPLRSHDGGARMPSGAWVSGDGAAKS